MAKGDDSRSRNQIKFQGDQSQNLMNNLRDTLYNRDAVFGGQYQRAADRAVEDYGSLMSGYNQFQQTGGYSPSDISAMRARSISPIRSVYANANRDIDRQRTLQGGYSPNYTASKAKMAREMGMTVGDANTNLEAALAQMRNEGKRFGLSGASSLYSSTPGMANMFGNQVLGSSQDLLGLQGLQNQLGLGIMNAQIGASHLPGQWQSTMGNINSTVDTLGNIGKTAAGFGGLF